MQYEKNQAKQAGKNQAQTMVSEPDTRTTKKLLVAASSEEKAWKLRMQQKPRVCLAGLGPGLRQVEKDHERKELGRFEVRSARLIFDVRRVA